MLNQKEAILIPDNYIDTTAVIVIMFLLLIIYLVVFIINTELDKKRIRALKQYKNELKDKNKRM